MADSFLLDIRKKVWDGETGIAGKAARDYWARTPPAPAPASPRNFPTSGDFAVLRARADDTMTARTKPYYAKLHTAAAPEHWHILSSNLWSFGRVRALRLLLLFMQGGTFGRAGHLCHRGLILVYHLVEDLPGFSPLARTAPAGGNTPPRICRSSAAPFASRLPHPAPHWRHRHLPPQGTPGAGLFGRQHLSPQVVHLHSREEEGRRGRGGRD